MSKTPYLALLRGINVGGRNIIKMSDLKACFENMNLVDVTTYIQSGNVIFSPEEKNKNKLVDRIEKELSKKFDYNSKVVILSDTELKEVIENAPLNFSVNSAEYRYDVLFVKEPLSTKNRTTSNL